MVMSISRLVGRISPVDEFKRQCCASLDTAAHWHHVTLKTDYPLFPLFCFPLHWRPPVTVSKPFTGDSPSDFVLPHHGHCLTFVLLPSVTTISPPKHVASLWNISALSFTCILYLRIRLTSFPIRVLVPHGVIAWSWASIFMTIIEASVPLDFSVPASQQQWLAEEQEEDRSKFIAALIVHIFVNQKETKWTLDSLK